MTTRPDDCIRETVVGMQRERAAVAARAHQGAVTDTNHGAALADWSAVRRSKSSSVSLTMCPEGSSTLSPPVAQTLRTESVSRDADTTPTAPKRVMKSVYASASTVRTKAARLTGMIGFLTPSAFTLRACEACTPSSPSSQACCQWPAMPLPGRWNRVLVLAVDCFCDAGLEAFYRRLGESSLRRLSAERLS